MPIVFSGTTALRAPPLQGATWPEQFCVREGSFRTTSSNNWPLSAMQPFAFSTSRTHAVALSALAGQLPTKTTRLAGPAVENSKNPSVEY